MSSLNGVDPREVLSSLGFASVRAIEPLNGGMDTMLWRFEAEGSFVLRLFRREQAEVTAKEEAVMALLRDLGYPVPQVQLAGSWRQRPALVMELVEGSTFSAALAHRPWSAFGLGQHFGRAQAELHALQPPPERLPHALSRPARSWIDWSHPDEHTLRARLRDLSATDKVIIHLDFHPMNVLTGPRDVTAVLDWAHVHFGDPRADLARTESILLLTPQAGPARRLVQSGFVAGWRSGYRARRGPQAQMPLFRAWAGAAMLADLLPHRDIRGFPEDLYANVTRWMTHWKREAGIA